MAVAADTAVQISGPWTHRSVSANGSRFHVAEAGDGPLVLLLHGFPLDRTIWDAQFAALEKLASLNATVVKNAFEDSIASTRALLGAKDVQEFVGLQNTFAQPAIEKAIAYSKSVYEVATDTNAELSKVAERRVAEWNENFVSLLDKVSKNAPAGSDIAVAAVKSMLAAANSAYDNMNRVAKQATEMAEANVSAATETVKGLAKTKKAA